MAWNPLHDTLLSSSVLAEGPDVVAILALFIASANRSGQSELTIPFCASVLRISDARAEEAFRILTSPDPKSRNKIAEGRRIVPSGDGHGWFLVSHPKYRHLASRQAAAERQARYMERKRKLEPGDAICDEHPCTNLATVVLNGLALCSAHAHGTD